VLAGQVLTYQLTATNAGPSAATDVLVLDELPPSATFLSATASQGSCDAGGGRVTCRLGNLTAGGSATVTIEVRPTQTGSIANRATVQADEPDPDAFDNAAEARTTVQPAADLALTLRDTPDPVRVRDRLTYEIVVANRGPSMAGTVTLVDSLPRDVRLVTANASSGSCSATRETVTCTAFGLDADSTLTATIVVTPKRTGTITNTASVTANVADPVPGDNAATESTAVS
jgi:uncharacterized repeat protein (TIGR01451 family)